LKRNQSEEPELEQKTKKIKREDIIKSFATLLAISTNNKKKICWTPSLLSSNSKLVALKVIVKAKLGEKIESSVDFKRTLHDDLSKISQSAIGKNLFESIPNAVKVPNEKFTYIIDVPENLVNQILDLSQSDDVMIEHLLQLPGGVEKIIPRQFVRNNRMNNSNNYSKQNYGGRQGGYGGGNGFYGRKNNFYGRNQPSSKTGANSFRQGFKKY